MKMAVNGCLLTLIDVEYPYTDLLALIRHIFIPPWFNEPFIQIVIKGRDVVVLVFLGRPGDRDFFAGGGEIIMRHALIKQNNSNYNNNYILLFMSVMT